MEKIIIIQTLAMILGHSAVLEIHRSQKSRWTSNFGQYRSFPAATFHPSTTIPAMVYPQNVSKAPEGFTKNQSWCKAGKSPRSWKSPVWLFHKGSQQDPQGPEWHPELHRTKHSENRKTTQKSSFAEGQDSTQEGVWGWFGFFGKLTHIPINLERSNIKKKQQKKKGCPLDIYTLWVYHLSQG